MPNDFSLAMRLVIVVMLGYVFAAGDAIAAQQHCPNSTAVNHHTVCGKGCDPSADKRRLENLAKIILKNKAPVCLLALVDPVDRGYSKKLAIKRVLWVRDNLIEYGVGSNRIAVELRPLESEADKGALQSIDIILGQ
jgi:hypothetical protein